MTTPGVPVSPGIPPLEGPARDALRAAQARMQAFTHRPALPLMPREEREEALKNAAQTACLFCVLPGAYVGSILPVPVEAAVSGTELFMTDGTIGNTVKSCTHHYNGGVRTIFARGTLPLRVTDDHPVLVFPALYTSRGRAGWHNRQRKAPLGERPIWRRADEVRSGDFAVSPVPQFSGPEPPERWAPEESCWLLGLLVGDGHTTNRQGKRYHVGLTLGESESVTADRAQQIFRAMGFRSTRTLVQQEIGRVIRLTVSSRELAEEVASLIGVRSNVKHLPSFVWSSKGRLNAAVDGLRTADGCEWERRGGHICQDVFTTSLTLAWQVWYAAIALGDKPTIRFAKRNSGYANAHPAWRVHWTLGTHKLFTVRLEDWYVMPIKSVESAQYDGPVYDLTATPEPVFVANGITTHNCASFHPGASTPACPRLATFELNGDGKVIKGSFWPDGATEDAIETDGEGKVRTVTHHRSSSWDTSRVVAVADVAEDEPEGEDDATG